MKIIAPSIAIVTTVLLSVAVGRAGDLQEKFYINADAGGIFQQDATFVENGWSSTASFDPGARIDLALGYNINDSLAVELESGVMWDSVNTIDGFALGRFGKSIDLYSIPVLAKLIYRFPTENDWTPYVGVGVGGNIGMFDGKLPSGSYSDTDVTLAFQAEAGVRYALSQHSSIGVAYKFLGTTDQDYNLGDRSFMTDHISFQEVYIHGIFVNFTLNF